MGGFLDGIGAVFSKACEWIPGKRESLQNKIDRIKKEMYALQTKHPLDSVRYERLADQLRDAEQAEYRAK